MSSETQFAMSRDRRGAPVWLAYDQTQRGTVAQAMAADVLLLEAHRTCRPYAVKEKQDGTIIEANALPSRTLAVKYLNWRGKLKLKPVNGIASALLLHADGTIHYAEGYDEPSGMWSQKCSRLIRAHSESFDKGGRGGDSASAADNRYLLLGRRADS